MDFFDLFQNNGDQDGATSSKIFCQGKNAGGKSKPEANNGVSRMLPYQGNMKSSFRRGDRQRRRFIVYSEPREGGSAFPKMKLNIGPMKRPH